MIKVAFGSVPKDGGTFTFYRNQSKALLPLGVKMLCVSVGKEQADLWNDQYADESCVLLAQEELDLKKQAQSFVKWCIQEDINIVMAINSYAILSAIPHLPKKVQVVSRCANAFDLGYRITMSGGERISKIVALTPRLKNDLISDYGADEGKIELIPNGVDPMAYQEESINLKGDFNILKIAFVGRLEHEQKGVLHIPPILKELDNIPYKLSIVGQGKHKLDLERALETEIREGKVEFLGQLPPIEIAKVLAKNHLYLFTSHFEGCPNSLLEAMMAGCIPMSLIIAGITDFIVEDGKTGMLYEAGDYDAIAEGFKELYKHPERLRSMSIACKNAALERFSNDQCAKAYRTLFERVLTNSLNLIEPKSWDSFKPDSNIPKGRLDFLPVKLRYKIRQLLSQ